MKTILVIEDKLKDFEGIKNHFDEWEIYPNSIDKIDFELDKLTLYVKDILEKNNEIVALIVDIALIDDNDETGIKLISNIRSENGTSLKNKIVPIFCYSKHIHLKKKALKAGATSFFSKETLLNKKDHRYTFLKHSIHALSFLYIDAIKYTQNLQDFEIIVEKLQQSHIDNQMILNAILQLLSYSDIDNLLDSVEIENVLIERLGKDAIDNLKKVKLSQRDKKNIESQLDDIADIIGSIPGLSPFAGILKGIKLFSKSLW